MCTTGVAITSSDAMTDSMASRATLERQAQQDRTVLDLVRLCAKGASHDTLLEVTQLKRRDLNRSIERLRSQALITLRTCPDQVDRWFWLTPMGLTRCGRTG